MNRADSKCIHFSADLLRQKQRDKDGGRWNKRERGGEHNNFSLLTLRAAATPGKVVCFFYLNYFSLAT